MVRPSTSCRSSDPRCSGNDERLGDRGSHVKTAAISGDDRVRAHSRLRHQIGNVLIGTHPRGVP
jgi:hypothetical protein